MVSHMEPITDLQALGRAVAARLEQAGITQRDASQETGIPLATLNRRLRQGDFRLSELTALATLLGVTDSQLLAESRSAAA